MSSRAGAAAGKQYALHFARKGLSFGRPISSVGGDEGVERGRARGLPLRYIHAMTRMQSRRFGGGRLAVTDDQDTHTLVATSTPGPKVYNQYEGLPTNGDANVTTILFVPGKNPKPAPKIHREWLWRTLVSGVGRVRPAAIDALLAGAFHLIAWNQLYYGEIRPEHLDTENIEALLHKTRADRHDRQEARSFGMRGARLLYLLGDLFPFLIPLAPHSAAKNTIAETNRYFENQDGIASRVREVAKAPLRAAWARGDPVLLIGHSMGSIIAYDALWELWHEEGRREQVDLFLTLGSPLGMRFVQRRLCGANESGARRYPGNIRRWINIATQGDLTALDPSLRDDFGPMRRLGLVEQIEDVHKNVFGYFRGQDGLNVHRSYGYLVLPQVGTAIGDWVLAQTPIKGKENVAT